LAIVRRAEPRLGLGMEGIKMEFCHGDRKSLRLTQHHFPEVYCYGPRGGIKSAGIFNVHKATICPKCEFVFSGEFRLGSTNNQGQFTSTKKNMQILEIIYDGDLPGEITGIRELSTNTPTPEPEAIDWMD